jgi:tetratricopeptide (TPR) repeat protein
MFARQERQSEDERERAAAASAAKSSPATPRPTSAAASAAPVVPSQAPSQPAPSETAAAMPSAGEIPSESPPGGAAAAPAPGLHTGPISDLGTPRISTGALHPAQEMSLETSPASTSGSLVEQATRAMVRGDVAHAQDLARQAVASNPANADTWLTLGAALQAAGNPSAAREAYRSCITQAHSANVSECRVLGSH